MVYRARKISLICAAFLVLAGSLMGSVIPGAHASDEPIKVGAPIPITGPFASDGFVMEKAEKLAIADINAQGGLLGRQIEMIVYDIGDLTPDKLQAAALNLVEQEEVHVLINGYGGMGPISRRSARTMCRIFTLTARSTSSILLNRWDARISTCSSIRPRITAGSRFAS